MVIAAQLGIQTLCTKGEKETPDRWEGEGEGLTWLPTLLASVLVCGSQYDVIGDPWS